RRRRVACARRGGRPNPVRRPAAPRGGERVSAAGGLRGTRRALPVAGVVAAILLAAAVAGAPAGGPPLDPTSTAPGGTKAVVDTLVELGVDVAVEPAALSADVDRALLL